MTRLTRPPPRTPGHPTPSSSLLSSPRGDREVDAKACLALARSADKSAQATAALALLGQQLVLVKHLPLQVRGGGEEGEEERVGL